MTRERRIGRNAREGQSRSDRSEGCLHEVLPGRRVGYDVVSMFPI